VGAKRFRSTILTLLARLHCCEHIGYSKVTKHGFDELFPYQTRVVSDGGDFYLPSGVEVQHDGQEVRYFNPEKVVGMEYGMAAFDYEVDNPVAAFMIKGSCGQLNVHRLGEVLVPKLREKIEWVRPPDPNYKPEPERQDHYREQQMWLQEYLKGTMKPGQPTVLLDEPDAGMDWLTKESLWTLIMATSDRKQYIIASHSIFAMNFPGANFIELTPGYLEKCRQVVKGLVV